MINHIETQGKQEHSTYSLDIPRKINMPLTKYIVLETIKQAIKEDSGCLITNESLAFRLNISKATVIRIINQLVKDDFLRRTKVFQSEKRVLILGMKR